MRRFALLAVAATALAVVAVPVRAAEVAESAEPTTMPAVEREITGGRTGKPLMGSAEKPSSLGYVEKEFLISGIATDHGDPAQTAPYATQLYVMRPTDPADFNGTVVVDWFNVSGGMSVPVMWGVSREYLVREGYAYVGVSAQKIGVTTGLVPLSRFDPVRYRGLRHPGDAFSNDIFSQSGRLVEDGRGLPIDPLGGLDVEATIAVGQSQSGRRLLGYINEVHEKAGVYDGFVPSTADVPEIRDDVSPILWVNSESEADEVHAPDSGLYRMWEIAGASHFGAWGLDYMVNAFLRSLFPQWFLDLLPPYDPTGAAYYYGARRYGGTCPNNFFPDRHAYNAAIDAVDRWVRTGDVPDSVDRLARDEDGNLLRDEAGNALGGLRLPPIDVPVARYDASVCALFGRTLDLTSEQLADRYPTHAAYVQQMQAATDAAVAAGHMLPFDADELMAQVEASPFGG